MNANASTAGLRVLRHVLNMPLKDAGAALSKARPYLTQDDEKKTLNFIQSHISKHGKPPHPDTVLDVLTVFLPETTEPFDFDLAVLTNRFIEDHMRDASDKASALLLEGNATGALKALIGDLLPLTQGHATAQLFDMRQAGSSSLAHYKAQLAGTAPPVHKLGYPTLDSQGGIEPGDMIAVVGRPGSGKTWLMLMLALSYWGAYGEPVLFVTQEMSAMQIEKRALPLMAGVDPTPLYRGEPLQYALGGKTHDEYLAVLEEQAAALKTAPAPFLIYDSKMAGTVADIEAIAAMHGISKVFVDGAYMLRHPDPRLGRYARVPENLDLMKYLCQRTGISIVSSWQFKRNAGKDSAAGETPDLDDIGYSHAIGEYMGVVLGLLENPKSVAQMNKKKVSIMKGRNGEVGSFDIHWDFSTMNFTEITVVESQADLTYL